VKRLEVRLNLSVVAPLLDAVKTVSEALSDQLAAPLELGEVDEDLRGFWREELVSEQNGDIGRLLGLFGEEFFATGIVTLDSDNAEPIIRACAAVRLRLRSEYLGTLPDEMLETGDVRVEELPENVRNFFLCYLFLATLQELIIQHLDEPITDD
jgi:hypothetical protein